MIAVHISAVIYYLIYKKENLIVPMFNGIKQLPEVLASKQRRIGGTVRALLVLAIVAVGVYFLVR